MTMSNRKGGVVYVSNGDPVVCVVWHWLWRAPICNMRNKRDHGWTIIAKQRDGLKQFVSMQQDLSQ